jgi:hypothetical protein
MDIRNGRNFIMATNSYNHKTQDDLR